MNTDWIQQWRVKSSSSSRLYTISKNTDGEFGCSCPAWTKRSLRKDCKHIIELKKTLAESEEASEKKEEKEIDSRIQSLLHLELE